MKASEYAQTPDPDGVRRFVLFCQRQMDDEGAPLPYPAVHGDGAAVEPAAGGKLCEAFLTSQTPGVS